MNFEGLVNDGAWMATSLNLPEGTWTNPDNEQVATATSWALLLPAYGAFQRLISRGFLARGYVEEVFVGQVNSPMIEMEGRANTAPASAWRISNARPPDRARLPSRTGSTLPMSAES